MFFVKKTEDPPLGPLQLAQPDSFPLLGPITLRLLIPSVLKL